MHHLRLYGHQIHEDNSKITVWEVDAHYLWFWETRYVSVLAPGIKQVASPKLKSFPGYTLAEQGLIIKILVVSFSPYRKGLLLSHSYCPLTVKTSYSDCRVLEFPNAKSWTQNTNFLFRRCPWDCNGSRAGPGLSWADHFSWQRLRGSLQTLPAEASSPFFWGIELCTTVVPNLGPPDVLGLQLPEILASRSGGESFWEL